ncbi:MAG: methyltransferase domain-containing protein [Candidatus Peribacteraceae bacterium]|nr:methyltransferase domain-containing protein [Candidatus Peribacteraceae bacterium]
MKKFLSNVREFFYQLLRVSVIRLFVAVVRYVWFVKVLRRLKTVSPSTGDIGVNAVHHNLLGLQNLRGLAVPRSHRLLYPLAALRFSKSSPILSIGPRSEGELLNFWGLGFRNVRGLDLISYSPWIDLGDMHAMPYETDRFGAVIMGWVLAYSDNRKKAAQEAVRVTRPGGIIAVGVEYRAESAEELSKKVGYELCDEKRITSVAEILELFGESVDRIFFRQDLPDGPCEKWDLLVLFSVKK